MRACMLPTMDWTCCQASLLICTRRPSRRSSGCRSMPCGCRISSSMPHAARKRQVAFVGSRNFLEVIFIPRVVDEDSMRSFREKDEKAPETGLGNQTLIIIFLL